MTMAYILAVNPGILGATGMDSGAVFYSDCSFSIVATLCMAFGAKLSICTGTWYGLKCVFCLYRSFTDGLFMGNGFNGCFAEGIIFILLSLTNVLQKIFNAIPMTLKHSVSAGIGLLSLYRFAERKDRSRQTSHW